MRRLAWPLLKEQPNHDEDVETGREQPTSVCTGPPIYVFQESLRDRI